MMMLRSFALATALGASLAGPGSAATPPPAAGGANQVKAVSGCANQWLFNGVWRFKVDSLAPDEYYNRKEWKVTVEIRNGTRATHELKDTGVNYTGRGVQLIDTDGNAGEVDGDDFYYKFSVKDIIQGGGMTHTLLFREFDGKPAKLIFLIDPAANGNTDHVKYSVKDPTFRVDLTCGLST